MKTKPDTDSTDAIIIKFPARKRPAKHCCHRFELISDPEAEAAVRRALREAGIDLDDPGPQAA